MGMRAPVTGSGDGPPRELPPPGKYLGICNGVYMLGTQPGYQGAEPRPQVLISFELHKRKGPSKDSQGRAHEVGAICGFTANVKSKMIELAGALMGTTYTEDDLELIKEAGGFDPEPLLGRVCWIDIVHEKKADGTPKDKIKAATPLDPDDDKDAAEKACSNAETDQVYWDWTLGLEVPRRIKYFWDRAAENPDHKPDPSKPGLPSAKYAEVEDTADIPF